MKQIILTEEEAKAILNELKKTWITIENQQIIYNILRRIEVELEN